MVNYAVNGGAADAVALGDLAQALPALTIYKDSFAVEVERFSSDLTALEASAPHAGAHPLDDKIALEFGHDADDRHDGTPQRVRKYRSLREIWRTRLRGG